MTAIVSTPQTSCNIAILSDMTMKRATVIAERTKSSLVGVTKAMLIEVLKTKLANGVALFVFVKKDGTLRHAFGTTKKELAESHINGSGKSRESYATCAYWDCEKAEWRSFRWESLVQVL